MSEGALSSTDRGASTPLRPEDLPARLEAARGRVLRALRARLGSRLRAAFDPEDLWQETCLRACEAAADGAVRDEGDRAFVRWTTTVALRVVARSARKLFGAGATRPEIGGLDDLADALARTSAGPATRAQRRDEAARVLRVLESLPAAQREVLTLDFVHLMTQAEIAEALGKPLETVRKAHFRAIRAVREALLR
jgi:RNA polymerase sigma factor (sigma-70 family)